MCPGSSHSCDRWAALAVCADRTWLHVSQKPGRPRFVRGKPSGWYLGVCLLHDRLQPVQPPVWLETCTRAAQPAVISPQRLGKRRACPDCPGNHRWFANLQSLLLKRVTAVAVRHTTYDALGAHCINNRRRLGPCGNHVATLPSQGARSFVSHVLLTPGHLGALRCLLGRSSIEMTSQYLLGLADRHKGHQRPRLAGQHWQRGSDHKSIADHARQAWSCRDQ